MSPPVASVAPAAAPEGKNPVQYPIGVRGLDLRGFHLRGFELRRAIGLFAIVLFLASIGCSGGTPQGRSGQKTGSQLIEKGAAATEIAESRLEEIGFRTLWKNPTGGPIVQAWVIAQNVYVVRPGTDHPLFLEKLDGESGLSVWVYPLEDKLDYPPRAYTYPVELRAANPDELYFITKNDDLVGLDDRYGAKNFSVQLDFPASTSPVADQENVFIGSWNRRFYAINKKTRLEQWSYITDDSLTAEPTVGDANVYFGSEDNNVYSMTRGGGYIPGRSWRQQTGGRITAPPLLYGDRIFVGSWDYKLYCLEDSGAEAYIRWTYPAGAPVVSRPFANREWVFLISQESRPEGPINWTMHAVGLSQGRLAWEAGDLTEVLAADALHVYGLDIEGNIRAHRLDSGAVDWVLDIGEFDQVIGQDARLGSDKSWWGRMFLIDSSGLVQAIRPRR